MEQHSLPQDPAIQATTDHTGASEQEHTIPASTPPTSQHEHSDSMVTIRLSNAGTLEANKAAVHANEELGVEFSEYSRSHADSIDGSVDDKERDSEVASVPSTEEAATIRAASPLLADADYDGSPIDDPQSLAESVNTNDALESVSIRSSADIMTADIARQSSTLGSELDRVTRYRSTSTSSSKSSGSEKVNWAELDKNEQQEERDDATDESTAFLLARLEQENNALATDPKAGLTRNRSASRPPSMHQLKKLVSEPSQQTSLRYSMLPSPPPMTELEFWSALVRNYPQTAQRLPTLTSNKIRAGIPPPLRGVVWMSIAGARDAALEEEYDRLSLETSPYEKLIHKDIGRSFPGVDMFRDPDGEGQKMLGKVLNAFSLYDPEIGYCQGLGFVVGPLLMHMPDKEAFCVLVRLIMHYDLRSCFLPDLSGLHLRIFQFQHLLSQHLPAVTAHLDKLDVEPLYLSQWFLSFFGVTCPLPMLIRIYDMLLTEGASETLMRVALSLMRRNEKKILAATEFEDVMQLLLSRGLWDTYGCNADDLVQDFCDWTGLVTREKLQSLEDNFKNNSSPTQTSKPSVHTAAARFLGRFWTGSAFASSPKSPSASSLAAPGRPTSTMRRTPSKQSMASTLNSIESSDTAQSSASTEATDMSRQVSGSGDWAPQKPGSSAASIKLAPNKDKGLHNQIEDLLTALSDLQREHSQLQSELQREREERDEDRLAVKNAIEKIKEEKGLDTIAENDNTAPLSPTTETVTELEERFTATPSKRSSLMHQTKHQLREEAMRWKDRYNQEVVRTSDLSRQLTDQEREVASTKDDLRDARARIQESHRERQRLEKLNQDLKSKSRRNTAILDDNSPTSPADSISSATSTSGLRELKLGRASTTAPRLEQPQPPQFSKRMSSLSTQAVLATEDHKPASEDALLLELVAAKTAEAVAKQELEEVKGKLDSLRKMLSGNAASPGAGKGERNSPPVGSLKEKSPQASTPASVAGGWLGWGKRTASSGQ